VTRAFYSFREHRDLARIAWAGLDNIPGQWTRFVDVLRGFDPVAFGAVGGTLRVAHYPPKDDGPYEVETWPIDDALASRASPSMRPLDARLVLQPIVFASDREIELMELHDDDSSTSLGAIPLTRASEVPGQAWRIVGHPPDTADDESILFADVAFGMPESSTSMALTFRSRCDLWLPRGLDGEPTDNRANGVFLHDALVALAAKTGGRLSVRDLVIA
jgi:hypothetical protein